MTQSLWMTWAFRILSLVIALMVLRALFAPLALVMPEIAAYFPAAGAAAIAHIVGGPIALALAPFQVAPGLRARRPDLHRLMGYGYGLAILVSAVASLAMVPHFRGSAWAATGFAVLALLWIGVTGRGIWLARQRRYAEHRRWMVRSVALTFAAVTLRLMMLPMVAAGWTVTETYNVTAWASWLINLAFVELIVLRRPAASYA